MAIKIINVYLYVICKYVITYCSGCCEGKNNGKENNGVDEGPYFGWSGKASECHLYLDIKDGGRHWGKAFGELGELRTGQWGFTERG